MALKPVLLGEGKTVFPSDGEKRPLELLGVTTTGRSVLWCVYRPGETPPMPDWVG